MVTASGSFLCGKDGLGARVAGAVEQVVQVAAESVCVLLEHAPHVVHHLPREVRDGLTEDEANVRSAYLRVGGYRIRMAVGYEVRHAAREKLLDLGLSALRRRQIGAHHIDQCHTCTCMCIDLGALLPLAQSAGGCCTV